MRLYPRCKGSNQRWILIREDGRMSPIGHQILSIIPCAVKISSQSNFHVSITLLVRYQPLANCAVLCRYPCPRRAEPHNHLHPIASWLRGPCTSYLSIYIYRCLQHQLDEFNYVSLSIIGTMVPLLNSVISLRASIISPYPTLPAVSEI